MMRTPRPSRRSRRYVTRMITMKLLLALIGSIYIVGCKAFVLEPPKVARKTSLVSWTRYHGTTQLCLNAATTDMKDSQVMERPVEKTAGNVVFLLPSSGAETTKIKFGSRSPVGNPSVSEATAHLMNKAYWFSEGLIKAQAVTIPADDENKRMLNTLEEADALIALGLMTDSDLNFARSIFEKRLQRDKALRTRQCQFGLQCATKLPEMVGPYDESTSSLKIKLAPWTQLASGRRMHDQMLGLFDRWTTDDFTVALMIFFHQFSGSEIQWVRFSSCELRLFPIRDAIVSYCCRI